MTRTAHLLLGLALVSALPACGSTPDPVRFTTEWPAATEEYEDVTSRWTRRGLLRAPIANQGSQLLDHAGCDLAGVGGGDASIAAGPW